MVGGRYLAGALRDGDRLLLRAPCELDQVRVRVGVRVRVRVRVRARVRVRVRVRVS